MIICNLHSGNQAWLASLRSNLITMFELMDFGHNGSIDLINDDYCENLSFKQICEALEMEDIKTGHDLNTLLLELENRKFDREDIENYLFSIIFDYIVTVGFPVDEE